MSSKINKHKDVCRIDQKETGTVGWYVRVRYQGKTHSKFISDKLHGGTDDALNTAIIWRNETEQRIGKPRTDLNLVNSTKSETGVVGVLLNQECNRYEICWINPDGKQKRTSFSIEKYGSTKAFKMACDIRREKNAERLQG